MEHVPASRRGTVQHRQRRSALGATAVPSRWASNFEIVCDAVGLLAWRLARAVALIVGSLVAHEATRCLDDIAAWLPPIA